MIKKVPQHLIDQVARALNEETMAPEAPVAPPPPKTRPTPSPKPSTPSPKPGKPGQPWKDPFKQPRPNVMPEPMNQGDAPEAGAEMERGTPVESDPVEMEAKREELVARIKAADLSGIRDQLSPEVNAMIDRIQSS